MRLFSEINGKNRPERQAYFPESPAYNENARGRTPGEREKGKMKRHVFSSVCALLLAASVLFAAVPARADGVYNCGWQYVSTGNAGRLHLREYASRNARSLGLYLNGTPVRVLSSFGPWAYVNVNGAAGYMMTRYLAAYPPQPAPNPVAAIRYVRTGNAGRLHLRAYASRDARSLGLYANGTPVTVIADCGAWCYVNAAGKTGYMMSVYLTASPAEPSTPTPKPTPTPYPAPYSVLTVRQPNNSFVYLRSSSTSDSNDNVICKVQSGCFVTLLEWGAWWSRVSYGGVEGYMASRYLQQ
jgi:uncharacterized protein YgiM (DUF1202 family)